MAMTTINTFLLFPSEIETQKIDTFLKGLKTINFVFCETGSFMFFETTRVRHKYVLETNYPNDLVKIGYWMANEEARLIQDSQPLY